MAKLVFLAMCGVGVVLLIAYGANAEFDVVKGRAISDRQQEVLAWLVLAAVVLGSAISSWLKYWESDPRRWKD